MRDHQVYSLKIILPLVIVALSIVISGCESTEQRQLLEEETRSAALAFLKTEPDVEAGGGSQVPWNTYFNRNVGIVGPMPDYAWFEAHASEFRKNRDGTYTISWKGLPGCEQDPSQPGSIDYGPNWFDENGERCYQLWLVEVCLDKELGLIRVKVSTVGGIAKNYYGDAA